MLSLRDNFNKMLGLEAIQVRARGERGDVRDDGELGARARVTIHQTKQHARACRLPDGPRDSGHCNLVQIFYIHVLMVNESSPRGQEYV